MILAERLCQRPLDSKVAVKLLSTHPEVIRESLGDNQIIDAWQVLPPLTFDVGKAIDLDQQ